MARKYGPREIPAYLRSRINEEVAKDEEITEGDRRYASLIERGVIILGQGFEDLTELVDAYEAERAHPTPQ